MPVHRLLPADSPMTVIVRRITYGAYGPDTYKSDPAVQVRVTVGRCWRMNDRVHWGLLPEDWAEPPEPNSWDEVTHWMILPLLPNPAAR